MYLSRLIYKQPTYFLYRRKVTKCLSPRVFINDLTNKVFRKQVKQQKQTIVTRSKQSVNTIGPRIHNEYTNIIYLLL